LYRVVYTDDVVEVIRYDTGRIEVRMCDNVACDISTPSANIAVYGTGNGEETACIQPNGKCTCCFYKE